MLTTLCTKKLDNNCNVIDNCLYGALKVVKRQDVELCQRNILQKRLNQLLPPSDIEHAKHLKLRGACTTIPKKGCSYLLNIFAESDCIVLKCERISSVKVEKTLATTRTFKIEDLEIAARLYMSTKTKEFIGKLA